MNILVTGGAGFIGSHLCDKLLEKGYKVYVVDNLVLGREENIMHLYDSANFEFNKVDLLDLKVLSTIFKSKNFDVVFHLAANSDIQKGGSDPNVDLSLTFQTTFNVLQCMREFNVKQLIFASTSAIYGEVYDNIIENYGPLQPVSNYGAGKLASEAFISAFSSSYGIQTWITRFPNVVGERFTHGVIFDFIKKLNIDSSKLMVLGNGEQNKPYLYVKDLIDAIIYVWENAHEKYNVYNIGVSSRTKVKEIAAIVIEEMELNSKIIYTGGDRGWVGDVPEFKYDLSKINNLGWISPRTSNDAIRLAVKKALGK